MLNSKLETLLKVYELKSFTRAAEQLSMTQPAVSLQVKQLEQELNVRIFNRSRGELSLTGEGEIVLKYAKRIKMLYKNMEQRIEDERRRVTRLTVGITHTRKAIL